MPISQSASALLMVRPASFGYDEQTAVTNVFQNRPTLAAESVHAAAEAEFSAFVEKLRSHAIEVVVFDDPPRPPKPNAVFPNNWITTLPGGRVYLYPMATASRRPERDPAVLELLAESFTIRQVRDLSESEQRGQFLEGTGAIVFDHVHKLAYACLSPRCDEALFNAHVADLGYTPVAFHASDQGAPVYHTNVMLGIQSTTAVICSQAITSPGERAQVLASLESTGHIVVDITPEQMNNFCGNVLEVRGQAGERFLILSAAARAAFTPDQIKILGRDKTLLPVAIPTIEAVGGGSARCMVAEIWLTRRAGSAK